jgi:hypothetical protein
MLANVQDSCLSSAIINVQILKGRHLKNSHIRTSAYLHICSLMSDRPEKLYGYILANFFSHPN